MIGIGNIIADTKISRLGVDMYKEKIIKNEKLDPLTVLKHPNKDIYAVLDGHHRFYAYLECGIDEIECDVVKVPLFVFDYAARGFLQPDVFVTENFRIPIKRFANSLTQIARYSELEKYIDILYFKKC